MIVYTPFNGSLTYKLTVSLSTLPVFFFQAEVGIRAGHVTGVQTCALPISRHGVRLLVELIYVREEFSEHHRQPDRVEAQHRSRKVRPRCHEQRDGQHVDVQSESPDADAQEYSATSAMVQEAISGGVFRSRSGTASVNSCGTRVRFRLSVIPDHPEIRATRPVAT